MNKKAAFLFRCSCFALFIAVASSGSAAPEKSVDTAPASRADNVSPTQCLEAMYRFLPGEFNFCVAAVEMFRGNYKAGLEMLKLAAGWGSKKAQYVLGVTYFRGDSIPADRPLGLAWLTLGSERNDPTYRAVLASARSKATPDERQRAIELLTAMEPVYADAIAARRAQRRFDRAMRELTYHEPYDVGVCIKGLTGGLIPEDEFMDSSCPPPLFAAKRLYQISDVYFDGWTGHVSVGDILPASTRRRSEPGSKAD